MNNKETIREFSKQYGWTQRDIRAFMNDLADFVVEELADGEEVHFMNFLKFKVYRSDSPSFDFKTGEYRHIKDKVKPSVHMSENMKLTIVDKYERRARHGSD